MLRASDFERVPMELKWQTARNESWPPNPREVRRKPRAVRVTARVVWSKSGEEWVDGVATKWTREQVWVEVGDLRLGTNGVWLPAADVRRKPPTSD